MNVNGSIVVNNSFIGDAHFCIGHSKSEISAKLVRGLPQDDIEIETKGNGCDRIVQKHRVVDVPVRLGTLNYETLVQMVVLADHEGARGRVVLGMDFMDKHAVKYDKAESRILSPNFGEISVGVWREFQRIHDRMEIDGKLGHILPYDSTKQFGDRVILLLDIDSFEVQVHQQHQHLKPVSTGKPTVVVNPSRRVTAASRGAKDLGINRSTTPHLNQAEKKCGNLNVIYIPERSPGRVDTSIARIAKYRIRLSIKQALDQLGGESTCEMPPGDEIYMDVTAVANEMVERHGWYPEVTDFLENTYLYNAYLDLPAGAGLMTVTEWIQKIKEKDSSLSGSLQSFYKDRVDLNLLFGAVVAKTIIRRLLHETGFHASVGVGSNKLIAKIASGLKKPRAVTVALPSGFQSFSQEVKIESIPFFGGTRGEVIKSYFGVTHMNELKEFSAQEFAKVVVNGSPIGDKDGFKYVLASKGFCLEPVRTAPASKIVSISQQLSGRYSKFEFNKIIEDRTVEMIERCREDQILNGRWPVSVKVSIKFPSGTRSFNVDIPPETVPPTALSSRLKVLFIVTWIRSEAFRGWIRDEQRIVVKEIKMMASFGIGRGSSRYSG